MIGRLAGVASGIGQGVFGSTTATCASPTKDMLLHAPYTGARGGAARLETSSLVAVVGARQGACVKGVNWGKHDSVDDDNAHRRTADRVS